MCGCGERQTCLNLVGVVIAKVRWKKRTDGLDGALESKRGIEIDNIGKYDIYNIPDIELAILNVKLDQGRSRCLPLCTRLPL